MTIGKLWYGSWRDYKKIRELYDIDFMVSICRYPPYRYYGSEKETNVINFSNLGPSPELHRWTREKMSQKNHDWWNEYAGRYRTELGTRLFGGKMDEQYEAIVQWLFDGWDVCLLCTCLPDDPCHRFLLWNNINRTQGVPLRGGSIKLDWPFPVEKVTNKTWEKLAIHNFQDEGRVGEENGVMLACPHVEMSAAYDRLIKKGVFGKGRKGLYLEVPSLKFKGE